MDGVFDWAYNAMTGKLTEDQARAIQSQADSDIQRAGGSMPQSWIDKQKEQGRKEVGQVIEESNKNADSSSYIEYAILGVLGIAAIFVVVKGLDK